MVPHDEKWVPSEQQRPVHSTIPVLTVIKPGLWTTVQDLGRFGYRQYGVPPSGALDSYAFQAANFLVGNEPGAAGLEVSFMGPRLRAVAPCAIAVTGADVSLQINGRSVPTWTAHKLRPDDELSFGPPKCGRRAYMAVGGGIAARPVMGSRSTYVRARLGGIEGRPLHVGDTLSAYTVETTRIQRDGLTLPHQLRRIGTPQPARVILGPQEHAFAAVAFERLLGSSFYVTSQADRMGCRLRGPRLRHRSDDEHISDGVVPGSIQVPPDGQPIVLLADGPTTGGYPKIATVVSADIDFFAHVWAGDRVTFREISLTEASALRRRRKKLLAQIAKLTGAPAAGS